MTLRSMSSSFNPPMDSEGPLFKGPGSDNSLTQRKIFQLLSIIEPILLNDENVLKALNIGFIETLCEMLVFQSQNLQNIHKMMGAQRSLNSNNSTVNLPQYLKILIRCLTSMLRTDSTVERLLASSSCRPLMALTQILQYTQDEELTANSLKILRYCIKNEKVSHFQIDSLKLFYI